MDLSSVSSLKEICKMFVVKKGITRIDLPSTLAEEVEEMEGGINSIFTGSFQRHKDFSVIPLTIAWARGQWEFTMKNQETLVIKPGVELGKLGGELFLLPGRKVSIFDFKLDLGTKTLRFHGMCSSSRDPRGRSLNIVLRFEKIHKMSMVVLCRTSDLPGTVTNIMSQTFFRDDIDRDAEVSREDNSDSDSDSDSSYYINVSGFDSSADYLD